MVKISKKQGDGAFRLENDRELIHEFTYSGALSFCRRRYSRDTKDIEVVVSGIPYDNAVTNRPGTRFGPRAIRAASSQLAELPHFPYGFEPFKHLSVIDYGDCELDVHQPTTIFDDIESHATKILKSDAKMVSLGGDHSITYPLLKAHAKKYGPITLIQFDAHCDTWTDDGKRFDHGTMFARAANEGIIDVTKSTQIGLRTYNDTDYGFEILTSPWVHRNGIYEAINIAVNRAQDTPVYLSFDIDGLDPAFAPGTGTPEIAGMTTREMVNVIRGLSGLNLISADVVEVAPAYDHAEVTSLAAATIVFELTYLFAKK